MLIGQTNNIRRQYYYTPPVFTAGAEKNEKSGWSRTVAIAAAAALMASPADVNKPDSKYLQERPALLIEALKVYHGVEFPAGWNGDIFQCKQTPGENCQPLRINKALTITNLPDDKIIILAKTIPGETGHHPGADNKIITYSQLAKEMREIAEQEVELTEQVEDYLTGKN